MIGFLLIAAFAAAQGFAVLVTAAIALHLLGASSWQAKFLAMAVSYIAWIAFTVGGYSLLGGEGGFMDGFGMLLLLCFTALVSSFIWLVLWTIYDAKMARG